MEKAMRVLVGYASRFGSTRDIAMRIESTLGRHVSDVDIRSVEVRSERESVIAVGVLDHLEREPRHRRCVLLSGSGRRRPDLRTVVELL